MAIYLFESTIDPNTKAFTIDADGANLPEEHGPWRESGSGSVIPTGAVPQPVAVLLERDGYFIAGLPSIH